MKQKIEWYREVLELEPGSRVFFSLAKLLAADGQISEAVSTLQQGLRKHPDHIEARLLLVELLHLQNAEADLTGEIDGLCALLGSYPGFWKAWSDRLSANPATLDAAHALNFFAAVLQGQTVNWSAVFNRGIEALLQSGGEQGALAPAFVAFSPARKAIVPEERQSPSAGQGEAPEADSSSAPSAVAAKPSPAPAGKASSPKLSITLNKTPQSATRTRAQESEALAAPLPETAKKPPAPASSASAAPPEAALAHEGEEAHRRVATAEEEEGEEAFSLRTRSMAEVLAEQGDIAGALDIYTELIEEASPDGRASLEARAQELSSRMHASHQGEGKEEKTHIPGGESNRLVSLLESLAQRLEARAR